MSARLRPGARALTRGERTALRARHKRLQAASSASWLSEAHAKRTASLCLYVAELADDGVPLSQIGRAMGVSKQRAGQLYNMARGRHRITGAPLEAQP